MCQYRYSHTHYVCRSKREGGCSEFLPGGRFQDWETNEEMRKAMAMTPSTSDRVESSFGVLDCILSSNNNLSLHSAGGMTTWRNNHTSQWIDEMLHRFPVFAVTLLRFSQSAGIVLKKESDRREANAKKEKLKRMKANATKNRDKEITKINQLLDLEDTPTILKVSEIKPALEGRTPANATMRITEQVRMLRHRHSCPRKDLMSFTVGGKRHSHALVRQMYETLVKRIEEGKLCILPARSIEDIVIQARAVFRGDELTEDAAQRLQDRREYYVDMVQDCRKKRLEMTVAAAESSVTTKKKKRKRGRSKQKKKDNRQKEDGRIQLVGRKVTMRGDVWFMNPNLVFIGKITKRETYRGRGKGKARKMVDGYLVKWSDGKWENWPYESLVPCLVPLPRNIELGGQNLKEIEEKQDTNEKKEAGEVEVSELMNMSMLYEFT